jgi:MFS family permease
MTPQPGSRASRRDLGILLTGRVLRAFGFGFSAILLGIHLQSRGLTATEIGVFLAVGLAAASLTGLVTAAATRRLGRRRTLAAIGVLMAICGLDLAFATQSWLLLLAGLTGMIGAAGTDLGPFLAVEQSVLTETAEPAGRNRAFARYSLTGGLAGAAGGFLAGAGTDLARTEALFVLYAVIGLATALIPLLLSPAAEGLPEAPVFGNLRPLLGLSALFALDSLGGGLIVKSVIVYWLHVKFQASPVILGPSFAVMSLVGAASFEVAGWLSDRIGLVNTMVFTHLPSNLMLIAIPFLPRLAWALGVLIIWAALNGMDVPARQAYVVSIVKPNERSGAVAITGAVRGLAQAVGPPITGAAIQTAALGIPFFLAGTVKSIYDIVLYLGFRGRRGEHEAKR